MKSLEKISKKWGDVRYISNPLFSVLPTGSLVLDELLGIGGYPYGRIIEIYGAESSSKTTLCLHAAKEAQKLNLTTAFLDMESALDLSWCETIGLDPREEKGFYHFNLEYAEQALDILRETIQDFNLIILDSVASLVPKAELQGEIGDRTVGLAARLMSQTLRIIAGEIKRKNCIVIFTNQIRDTIGKSFGPSFTTTGGRALSFYSSIRIELFRSTSLGESTSPIGNKVRVGIKKSKVSPPNRKGELTLYYDEGISLTQELLDWGIANKLIKAKGAWYTLYPDKVEDAQLKFQGSKNIRSYLQDNGLEIENMYRQSLGLPVRQR